MTLFLILKGCDIRLNYTLKSNIARSRKLGIVSLIVLVMLLSSGTQIITYASALEVHSVQSKSSDPLVIKFGSSIEVNQGVQEFLRLNPNSTVINFDSQIESKINLFNGPVIYIGHGSTYGILYKNNIISWTSLIPIFQSAKSRMQFVLTCDAESGLKIAQQNGITLYGLPGKVDSIAGADLFSYIIAKSQQNQKLILQSSQNFLDRENKINLKLVQPMYLDIIYVYKNLGLQEASVDGTLLLLTTLSLIMPLAGSYLKDHIESAILSTLTADPRAGATYTLIRGLFDLTDGIILNNGDMQTSGIDAIANSISSFGLYIIENALTGESRTIAQLLFAIDLSDFAASIATVALIAAKLIIFAYTLDAEIKLIQGSITDMNDVDDMPFSSSPTQNIIGPTFSNEQPSSGVTETLPFTFGATTSDPNGIFYAKIYVDDNYQNPIYSVYPEPTNPSITTTINPAAYPGGSHTLSLEVEDMDGYISTFKTGVVFPTQIQISSPSDDASLSSTFNFDTYANDQNGIQNVSLNIDSTSLYFWKESVNQLLSDDQPVRTFSYDLSINPSNYAPGTYGLSVTVFNNLNQKWIYGISVLFPSTSGSGGGGGCIAKGTSVLLANGTYEKVQSLKIGDLLEGYNYNTQNLTTLELTNLTVTKVNKLIDINNGFLKITPDDQPIYIKNSTYQGWVINPIDLKVGDKMFDPLTNNWVPIYSITTIQGNFKVYDVVTSSFNNFIANGVLLDIKVQ